MNHPTEPDLIVYGGTPGGIACAVCAAREGLQVVLVNCTQHLGGMLSAGLGLYDTSYAGRRSPLVDEVFREILAHYGEKYGYDSENYGLCRKFQTFEPHVAEIVLTRLVLQEKNIRVRKGWRVIQTVRSGRRLCALRLRKAETAEEEELTGHIFVDASYEGDLAAAAGAPYRVGREGRAEHGEPHAGKIFSRYEEQGEETKKFPYAAAHGFINLKPFDLCTGRIFPGSTGEGDQAIMAYNFRISLSRDPANQVPIPKPAHYRRENFLGLLQEEKESLGIPYPVKSKWLLDDIRDFKFRNHRTIPNQKLSWNHGNFTGRNHDYPEADEVARQQILQDHRDHELGLLWFLQNDPAVPAEVRERAGKLGLAKDEFTDNGNFPWEFYVREARRIVGRAIFTELDASVAPGLERAPPHADSIAISEWMMDSHECTTERVPGSAYEGAVLLSELTRPAQIPYRCILPRGLDNLLVPICLSATHIGWGTIRVEPTWIQISESAGFACALARRKKVPPSEINVNELQRVLAERGSMISFFNDAVPGAPEPWVGAIQYFGTKGFFSSYDANPNRPIDPATARIWIRALGQILAGTLDPLRVARELARVGPEPGPGLTPEQFARSMEAHLSFEAGVDCSGDALLSEVGPLASPLNRGDACRLMAGALQRHPAVLVSPRA